MKIVKSSEVPWGEGMSQGLYQQRRKNLGGDSLACGLWELAPGKKSFPMHGHLVTEEALWVVSGKAKVHTQEGDTELGPGDFVHFPADGAAHQLVNHGSEPFVYVAMSATKGMDVVQYPDSDKLGIRAAGKRWVFEAGKQADYFAGEKDAQG